MRRQDKTEETGEEKDRKEQDVAEKAESVPKTG